MQLETDIIFVSLRIMFTWINYGDLGKRKGGKFKNAWFWVLITNVSPQIWERGDLFSIAKYLNSSVFLSTSINYARDFMCFKFKSNFKYKQLPIEHPVPDRLRGSSLVILFLVRISLTSLDMLVKAPGWMSWMMLLETLTESSLGWELRTRGVSLSEMKQNVRIMFLFLVL